MGAVWAVLLLGAMAGSGVAALARWRVALGLDGIEIAAYGPPLGIVVASLGLLWVSTIVGLSVGVVVAAGVASVIVAVALGPPGMLRLFRATGRAGRNGLGPAAAGIAAIPAGGFLRPRTIGGAVGALVTGLARFGFWPLLVIGGLTVRWAFFWLGALTYEADGLYAGQINIWGDWLVHIGELSTFAFGENLPPEHPRFSGAPLSYHYLGSFTAAAMTVLGMAPTSSLQLLSFLLSISAALSLFAFARRLTRDRNVAALAVVLYLLGSGLAWVLVVGEMEASGDPWTVLRERAWDGGAAAGAQFQTQHAYNFIQAQRGYMYGLPLTLLVFALLLGAVGERPVGWSRLGVGLWRGRVRESLAGIAREVCVDHRRFLAAGAVAGILPLAHLTSLLALALITPFLALLFPSRGWLVFGLAWVAIAVPQLLPQQGGTPAATQAMRWQVGWIASPDPWWWFWAKNLGAFAPLLIVALLSRRLVPPPARRFLWGFMPIFAIVNLVVFQPWDWDNTKLLLYWFVAVSILVAALIARTWRAHPFLLPRTLLAGTVATMLLSGILVNVDQMLGNDRYRMLSTEEVDLAAVVRAQTPPDAVFIVDPLAYIHPITLLSGRRVVMGYWGWLWTQGIDYAQRERDVRAVFALAPETPQILERYGVDYVVVGPAERVDLGADDAAFRARFPVALESPNYTVYAVDAD